MKAEDLRKQSTSLFQEIIENPIPAFLFMMFSVLLTYVFRNPAITFFGSIFLIFVFIDSLSEYILIFFGIFCYFFAIFSHTFGFDMREQLFLYSSLFFVVAFLAKLIHMLSGIEKVVDDTENFQVFPLISFWTQESVEALITLGIALEESPSEMAEEIQAEEKAEKIEEEKITLANVKLSDVKKENLPSQAQVSKENTGYKTVRIDGAIGTPVLDLTAASKTKPRFFDPPAKKPLSSKFIAVSLVLFFLVNAYVYWQRESIVGRISLFFGQAPVATSTPSYVTPLPDSSSSSLDIISLQKDFENVNFNPDNVTPIFTVAVTPGSITPTVMATGVAAQPTNPPLLGPTEVPLAADLGKKITVAILNGSGIAGEGQYVERQVLEQNGFYVEAIDDASLSEQTIIYYKSGQQAYADKAAGVLNSRYNVTTQQTLANSYFTDLKILVGRRK